ncbi:MAG: HAD-IC family P-type ATPase [Propionibacterium sp.]|nr:HAD-IC family P-type ATPase [Propionibacterium sp.]
MISQSGLDKQSTPPWAIPADELARQLDSGPQGLTASAAAAALPAAQARAVDPRGRTSVWRLLLRQFSSPIVLILIAATLISGVLGDWLDASIILTIVLLSGLLDFAQERGAQISMDKLRGTIRLMANVLRDGRVVEVPFGEVVPGDVVQVGVGDIIPADAVVLATSDLQLDQSTLTGEAFPVVKSAGVCASGTALAARSNMVFSGTHVASGSGTALVVATGRDTEFGRVQQSLKQAPKPTGFERGMTGFGLMLSRIMMVLVVIILIVNLLLKRPIVDSALFSLSLAVGLTPQLLPAIVGISLAQGAQVIAKHKVIVQRLNAIEDFGAMTALCTDKTGTMTVGSIELTSCLGLDGTAAPPELLRTAALNATLQRGFVNPMDEAIARAAKSASVGVGGVAGLGGVAALGEVPYDFDRKRLSVLVGSGGGDAAGSGAGSGLDGGDPAAGNADSSGGGANLGEGNADSSGGSRDLGQGNADSSGGGRDGAALNANATGGDANAAQTPLLVTKGAFDPVISVCTQARMSGGEVVPLAKVIDSVRGVVDDLGTRGLRVLAVATKPMPGATDCAASDESGLTLVGLLSFSDPVKPDAAQAIADFAAAGVTVRMITGDARPVAAHVAAQLDLDPGDLLTGGELDGLDDAALARRVTDVRVFCETTPGHKERIIRALSAAGETVGYMGDGINDTLALHAADVGITVKGAAHVAAESASIVMLENDLHSLLDGMRAGRRTFANTMKYIQMTTSANFGNMISMAVASLVLPFLPLLAPQILVINLLTDLPAMTIGTDRVDDRQLAHPQRWNMALIRNYMIVFGLVSSLFDIIIFVILRLGFRATEAEFQSTWFLASILTEVFVLFSLRTRGPIWRSRPSRMLVLLSASVVAITFIIVGSPLGGLLSLAIPPVALMWLVLGITVAYVGLCEVVKVPFWRAVRRAS